MRMLRLLGLGLVPALTACLAMGGCSARDGDDDAADSRLVGPAPDATGVGPNATTSAEYRFPASRDPEILDDRDTEVWGSVFRPAQLVRGQRHPLLVFLHGNHGTCGKGSAPHVDDNTQYTMEGTCPDGYTVVPNHRGYDYVAERLASWGYVVVSVNANRGITAAGGVDGDFGLNLARGRLVLKHLALLSKWNTEPGTTPQSLGGDLASTLDFDQVGLMGHSRGGEGVRAAYNLYKDAGSAWPTRIKEPLNVRGIFEVGPVDGQTSRTLDALGTAWNVLLPLCDGDVSNLQGMQPFDRMSLATSETAATPKSMFAVWGANHNYYNTEWQTSDSRGCTGAGNKAIFATNQPGSAKQQTTGLHAMMAFFRAHVGTEANPEFGKVLDPQFGLVDSLSAITRVERAYADAISNEFAVTVEDFAAETGQGKGGLPIVANGVTLEHTTVPEHAEQLKAAKISWTAAGPDTNVQVNWAKPGSGVDVRTKSTLDFRISRQRSTPNPETPTNFSIQLVFSDDSLSSPVALRDFIELLGPVGGKVMGFTCDEIACHGPLTPQPGPGHVVLDTVRIPLGVFGNDKLGAVRGVRFVFDDTAADGIFLSSVRFSRSAGGQARPTNEGRDVPLGSDPSGDGTTLVTTGNRVVGMQQATPDSPLQIELASDTAFPITNDFVRLRIGERQMIASRYPDDGDTHRIIFTVTPEQLSYTKDGSPMKVRYGDEVSNLEYDFGTFNLGNIQRQ